MDDVNWLNVVSRFLHVTAAMIAVGGAIFTMFAVMPAVHVIPDEARVHFQQQLLRRFGKLLMLSIGLLLLTGFYNYLVNERPAHSGQAVYHALMGVKILLAFGVFFLASVLTGSSPAFEGMRRKRKRWLMLNVIMALAIVAISAVLRAIPPVPPSA